MKTIIIFIAVLMTGCATCSSILDADLKKYSEQISMAKYSECTAGRARSAALFQKGMAGISNNYQQRANSYSALLPHNYNVNVYGQ